MQGNRKKISTVLLLLFLFSALFWGCLPAEEQPLENGVDPDDNEVVPDPKKDNGDINDAREVNEVKEVDFEEIIPLEDILQPVNPDEPLEYTLQERFSLQNSLWRVGQVRDFGFSAIDDLGLDGETQMAFTNWTGTIEGTLLKQDYEIKRLQLELARYKYKASEIDEEELRHKEGVFEESKRDFKVFWDSFLILD